MNRQIAFKTVACIVISTYLSVFCVHSAWATQTPNLFTWQLWAQANRERGFTLDDPNTPEQPRGQAQLTTEDRKARETILTGKMQRLEEEMNAQKGVRKNLLNIAVGAFAIGATLAFGVNQINAAIDDISVENPAEEQMTGSYEVQVGACETYTCYTGEKRDAQDSLDGIKGIGGGIFIVGVASVIGYLYYTYSIRAKQHTIETLRVESESLFETSGLTPEYLRRNESVAAVVEEIDLLKKKAGSTRTKSELFFRIALGTFSSGLFLFGLSNVSHTLVGNIAVDENNADDVTAKQNALDETDTLKDVGMSLMGLGIASGATSYVFTWLAKRHDRQINDLEDSLWRVANNFEFQPKVNGFRIQCSYAF